jgi:phosphate/sulfate permease
MLQGGTALAGLNVAKAVAIGQALLISPLVGFIGAIVLFVLLRLFVKNEKLYKEPKKHKAPPFWIRLTLLMTCSGVSFAHGSNDGQKGMGLVMLILLAGMPLVYGPMVATMTVPFWVKLSVAITLGFGTMIGYKRIVKTVGEKIGKSHLTYGQGAVAETMTALTIGVADIYGMPVSTTHVLNSAVGGTMAAAGAGLQWNTVRNILLAWVMTLPVTVILSGTIFAIFMVFI